MIEQQARDILERLAAGEITPAEAEVELRAAEEADADEPTTVLPTTPPRTRGRPVRAHVHGPSKLEIVGEEDTEDVRAYGPSELAQNAEGEVTCQLGDDSVLVVPADVDLTTDMHGAEAAIRNIRGSLQAEVNAGSLRCEAALIRGASTIEANVGDLDLVLDPSSDVRITVRAVASLNVSPRLRKTGRGQWEFGEGTSTLEISGHLGSISISVA